MMTVSYSDDKERIFEEYEDQAGNIDFAAIAKFILNSRGGTEFFILSRWMEQGAVDGYLGGLFQELVYRLWGIILRANYEEDNFAPLQLKAIEKLTYPEKYALPRTTIEKLITNYHTRPAIARAMELRAIMSNLAWVVFPASGNNCEVNKTIKLKTAPPSKHWEETYSLAKKHWTPGNTLQTLAIRVYLAQLQGEGVLGADEKGINETSLKKDLAQAARWETSHLGLPHWQVRSLSDKPIRVFEVSHEWKNRRRNRLKPSKGKRGSKKIKKLT
jgi:hypothetical protein